MGERLLLNFADVTQPDIMDLKHAYERFSSKKPISMCFQSKFDELCSNAYKRPESDQSRALLKHFGKIHAYLCKMPDEILIATDISILLNLAIEEVLNNATLEQSNLEDLEIIKHSDNGVWALHKFREGWRSNGNGGHWRHSSPNPFR